MRRSPNWLYERIGHFSQTMDEHGDNDALFPQWFDMLPETVADPARQGQVIRVRLPSVPR